MSASHANRRGIFAIIAAMAAFSANDAAVKAVARHCPLGEVLFVRGIMTCVLVGSLLVWLGHFADLRLANNRLVFRTT